MCLYEDPLSKFWEPDSWKVKLPISVTIQCDFFNFAFYVLNFQKSGQNPQEIRPSFKNSVEPVLNVVVHCPVLIFISLF
jgi:hypothetical protein